MDAEFSGQAEQLRYLVMSDRYLYEDGEWYQFVNIDERLRVTEYPVKPPAEISDLRQQLEDRTRERDEAKETISKQIKDIAELSKTAIKAIKKADTFREALEGSSCEVFGNWSTENCIRRGACTCYKKKLLHKPTQDSGEDK